MEECEELDKVFYYIDIPQFEPGNEEKEWLNVFSSKNKKECIKFAMDYFGADENGMISLITNG